MLRVGLTGGLATGKSHVARYLSTLGCHVLQADELGHSVMALDGEAYEEVIKEFGPVILDDARRINRKALAAQVFGKPERLEALNRIVHPAVIAREEEWMKQVADIDPSAIAILEAAILIETGRFRRFQRLILTVCSEQQQIDRAVARDGISPAEASARISHQMPLCEKREFADYIIDTSGTPESTEQQTRVVYEALRRIAS